MRRFSVALSLLVVAVLASACAPSSSKPDGPSARGAVIGMEEVRASGVANAFDLVQARRPAWLRNRSTESVSGAQVVIYMDNTRLGDPESLRGIAAGSIRSVERLDPRAAQFRFGSGHTHGAIVVITQ